jgi:hypothetical protein
MNQTPRAIPAHVWSSLLIVATLFACAPAKESNVSKAAVGQSKLVGNWQGKDPYDQSNISIQISAEAGQQDGQFSVKANDDKTTPDWCGVDASATATASLDANQALNVNLLWVCNNSNKTSQGFPTVITYNSSNDSITAYGATFTRKK